ncbi:zinc-ribbon domain-containing protein [Schlesneria sp. T3-172]|uniref:zinc-ribbon domain-containing protein n=1 Tax=Schlesneria sphaerica TaxID=3373610 RepID=UPI0037C777CF
MAGKVAVECPACTAKLNLSDDKLGKKVRCPKCAEVFQPEPLDDDFDDDVDEGSRSSSGKKRSSGSGGSGRAPAKGVKKGAKKGSSAEGGSSLPLIIGGSIAVVALIGVGIFASGVLNQQPPAAPPPVTTMPMNGMPMSAMPPAHVPTPPPAQQPAVAEQISPAEKTLALRWMPAEIDLLVHAKVADILQAPLLQGPLRQPAAQTALQDLEKQLGMAPADIESLSIGVVDLMGTVQKAREAATRMGGAGMPGPAVPATSLDDGHLVIVVKSKKPIDLKAIAQTEPTSTLVEKAGKTYFEVPPKEGQKGSFGGWSPAPDTLIVGTMAELLVTMDRGETVIPRKEFSDIDATPQLVIAGLNRNAETSTAAPSENAPSSPDFLSQAMKANERYGLIGGRLGLTVKGGFDLQVSALSSTPEGTQKVKEDLDTQLGQLRTQFDGFKQFAPPLIAEIGEMLLTNLKVDVNNSVVKVSTSVPDSAQQQLEQLPAVVMMMAMTGGLSGGAGVPGTGMDLGLFGGNTPVVGGELDALLGETEAVSASSVDGLPEGLTLTAKSAWSAASLSSSSPGAEVLEILIDVQGEGLEGICGATGATSKTITTQGGGTLKRSKRVPPSGIDPQKTFLPFDVTSTLPTGHPPMTLRVRMFVDTPAKMPAQIDVLEGSFKYLTADSTKEVTIENVPQRAKTPLTEPDFKAAGLKMIRSLKDVVPQTIKLQCGKDHFLSIVQGQPGDIVSVTEVERGATIQRLYSRHPDGKFPEEFEVAFKLYENVKEQTVNFRFENVPLPEQSVRLDASQQAIGVPPEQ